MVEPHVMNAGRALREPRPGDHHVDGFVPHERGLRRCTLYVFRCISRSRLFVPLFDERKVERDRMWRSHARAGRRWRRGRTRARRTSRGRGGPGDDRGSPFPAGGALKQTKVTTTTRHRCVPRPSPPAHFGDGATTPSHSAGVFAAATESEWKSSLPSVSAVMAAVTRRWRLMSGLTPSNLSLTTTTLKWLSSSRRPCDSLRTSRCWGAKALVSLRNAPLGARRPCSWRGRGAAPASMPAAAAGAYGDAVLEQLASSGQDLV